jgi:hypothetical protein
MDPAFGTCGEVGDWPLRLTDGADDDEEDETQDRRSLEGEDRSGGGAGARDGGGFGPALRGVPEPRFMLGRSTVWRMRRVHSSCMSI